MALRDLLSPRVLVHVLLVRPFLQLAFGVHVEGREHLEGLDRFILVANHNSHLDVLLLFHILPVRHLRRTHPVAAYEYFSRSRALLWLLDRLLEPVWIVRGGGRPPASAPRTAAAEVDALEGMRMRLAEGHSLVIFPEGTRGAAGRMTPFKTGVGRLAADFPDVPVVPVFLSGPERALPRSSLLLLPVWNLVTVGPPRLFAGNPGDFTAEVEGAVRELADSEAGRRHRRRTRARRIPAVAVLGIDGSGKSTLSRTLARRLSPGGRVCLVTDDIEVFEGGERSDVQVLLAERLRSSLGRRAKTAGSLESYKIPKLAELLLRDHIVEELRKWYAPDAIVLDGSPLLNITAWTRLYREDAFDESVCLSVLRVLSGHDEVVGPDDPVFQIFPELGALRRLRLARLVLPDAALFLDVDPAVAMERIRSRGEAQQAHEKEDELERLRGAYRMVCDVVERELGRPTRTLDGSLAQEEVAEHALGELGRMGFGERTVGVGSEGDAGRPRG
ncbi:MAG: 1-acyl-sn-glycerol-3-phosphate acyltransferase [Gemmatimonadota bacterium]|jgi:1-acyl-sn-glycerol-3-phosphate acyltransferase/thymidylate kinase